MAVAAHRMARMKRAAVGSAILALAALVGCRPSPGAPATPAGARAASPPWLVTIVVDQLAAWMADERWPALPSDGGFARLQREGLYVRELRFVHAVTETAPGHAALYTGAVPHATGIVCNDVAGPDGKKQSILADAATRLVPAGAGGPIERRGSSLAPLQVDTLADVLVAARPGAEVYSFSLKDRGALLAAGRRPKAALWLDTEGGTMVTSTAFAQAVPAWASLFADGAAVKRAFGPVWQPLDAGWLASHAATRDDQEGEGDYLGLGTVFPHSATSVKAMRATPGGDRLLLELARAAVTHAAESAAGRPVLLALSLSSHDYVAHVFGPDSWEAWDELRRLDRGLAELLAALDALVGPNGYAVMLTGDHGSCPLPEISRTGQALLVPARRGAGGHTGSGRAAAARASSRPTSRAGWTSRGRSSRAWSIPFVYLTPKGKALPPDDRAALHRRIVSLFAGAATSRGHRHAGPRPRPARRRRTSRCPR